jgi:hypothetical protein
VSIPQAGITPAASFELAGFVPQKPPPAILADLIDPETGDFASLTRSAGIADGMVQFLTTVQRGTGACVRSFGQRFREVTHNDERASETLESFVIEAVKPAVESGTVRFERITSDPDNEDPNQVNNVVEYIDLLAEQKNANQRKTFNP